MKKVLILAAAALALAACAKQQEIPVEETQPMAVSFDGYLNRSVTKADLDLGGLKTSGFGIFAYYTDNDNYGGSSIPNFMWNQEVTHSSKWGYTPLKYWPNEYGDNAVSEDSDLISFFAYAPYVEANVTTGKTANKTGIIGFTRNNYAGDPLVKYVVDLDPAKSVDLVWGRQPASNTFEAFDGTKYEDEGLPWLNVRRPAYAGADTEEVKFQFDHALASVNVTVDAFVDGINATNPLDDFTRIWIRSVTFTGFATEGTLNLNNIAATGTTPDIVGTALWQSINGDDLVTGEEVTIFDGRKDGREGTTATSNEKVLGLNEELIQAEKYTVTSTPSITTNKKGVTNVAVNLFNSATAADPIYVIPTGDKVFVTIAYDVETFDPNLATFLSDGATHGSSISNVITKEVLTDASDPDSGLILNNGLKYIIKLHLGMNSVKVNADVTVWGTGSTVNVDLPANQ